MGSEDSLGLLFVEELLGEEGAILVMELAHLKKWRGYIFSLILEF